MPSSRRPGLVLGCLLLTSALAVLGPYLPAKGAPPAGGTAVEHFENKVRPLLAARCQKCHGAAKAKGGLRLDTAAGLAKGGDSGPVIIKGKPDESLLIQAVRHDGDLKMPQGGKLSAREIADLVAWVKAGAVWPEIGKKLHAKGTWWAFRPVKDVTPPRVKAKRWVKSDLDAFILARLESQGLTPAPAADRRTLIRRAYFDLLGLPPPPEAVEPFVKDKAPDAFARLVDRLLQSPHYGERWGRHWLDVARYADSGGYETDMYYRNAWRYRDYVVKSFNDDKPYDRFVQEQIAGDEIWPDDLALHGNYQVSAKKQKHLEARIGTGLYTLGPQVHESNMDAKKIEHERLTDWVDTTGSVFMGLTVGCARCHDHKFDPISQRDYYALQAVFAGSQEKEVPLINGMEIADFKQLYPAILAVDEARKAYRLFERRVAGRALTAAEQGEKRKLLEAIAQAVLALPEQANSTPNTPWDGLMEIPTATVLGHRNRALVPTVRLLNRGDLDRPRQKVGPDLPAVLRQATDYHKALPGPFGSRKQLALWLTRPNHPLTARVMVNRIWQHHFGRGIVATPNDFGRMGQPPTHPELLDWLALRFVRGGWRVKEMHRLIMLSRTYQMASAYPNADNSKKDPNNRYLWRMNRRRLEAEALWDFLHATAGTLNLKTGGRPVVPPLAEDELTALRERPNWTVSADPKEHTRRGLYILVRRNFRFPMFEVFDSPVNSVSSPRRSVTTVAPQALWLLNNRRAFRQAQEFAGRLVREAGDRPAAWVDRAWRIALGRPPSRQEKRDVLRLLDKLTASSAKARPLDRPPAALAKLPAARAAALAKLCLAVFNLNEFLFID
jgi:mono/diheme cytochrome c family protein